MAIAFVAAGTRLKADVSATGPFQNVPLPAGHLSGHWLILTVVTENNTPPSTPSGWSLLGSFNPGASASVPYAGRPHLHLYHRIDTGALGSNVAMTFDATAWPTGDPYVLAWTEAYSGADTSGPVQTVLADTTLSTAAAHAHPIVSVAVNNSWLLTIRAVGADSGVTFGISGGTNTERVDDTHGSPASPSAASYDAGPLSTGAQTQRITTASDTLEYGSVAVSLVLKPAAVAGSATASPTAALGTATAYNATVVTTSGPWELCSAGTPEYSAMVDWDNLPTPMNSNWTFEETAAGWNAFGGATYDRSTDRAYEGMWSAKVTTGAAAGPRIESERVPVVAGRRYKASGWVNTDAVLASGMSFSINWYDALSGGTYLGTSSRNFNPIVDDWLYSDGFFVAPAGALGAGVLLDIAGTPGAGIHVYGDLIRIDDDEDHDHFTRADPSEETIDDIVSEISIAYGRDQDRQLNPAAVGSAAFSVINVDRKYSPENLESPLSGDLDPARDTKIEATWNGNLYPLFRGLIDDYNMKVDFTDRTVDFTFLDRLSLLQGIKLSTSVYASKRTGELINIILDLAGWPGPRDVDLGATVVPFWWAEGTDALTAIQDLVKSEGPPCVAYQAPDGTFIFRDRHHRLLRTESLASQGTFTSAEIGCASPPASGLNFTKPFVYSHGWRDIVNKVVFEVTERVPSGVLTDVWTSEDTITLAIGQSAEVQISTSDPFMEAVTPVAGTDFVLGGAGTVNVVLDRVSGASAKISLLAVGGAVTITGLRLRAMTIPVSRTLKVERSDTGSITRHGERAYPETAPWANANDADAIAGMILLHYSQRRPTVQIRIVTEDPGHFIHVLQRTVSDRIHITNGEAKLDDDFFIERVTHTVQRLNQEGKAPIHAVVFGCEKDLETVANPFTFDKRGAGFDDGVFDPIKADNASTVFIFDDPNQGLFDVGLFGT